MSNENRDAPPAPHEAPNPAPVPNLNDAVAQLVQLMTTQFQAIQPCPAGQAPNCPRLRKANRHWDKKARSFEGSLAS